MATREQAWAIFADFDGTLTNHDTIDLLIEHAVGRDFQHDLDQRLLAGKLTVRQVLDAEFALLSWPPEQVRAFLLAHVKVDPHFSALVDWARDRAYPLVIVSSGFDLFIQPLLRAAGCEAKVYCNQLSWDAAALRYRIHYLDDSDNGHDKAARVRQAKQQGYRIAYLGDGVTDIGCASEADRLFARLHLARHCRVWGIPYSPLRDCRDVLHGLDPSIESDRECVLEEL